MNVVRNVKISVMIKKGILLTTYFLFFSTLVLGPLFCGDVYAENFETKDCEVKLEGEVEEMIATKHLVEVKQGQFLYSLTLYPDHVIKDYEVFLTQELRPPRKFSQIFS